MSTKLSPKTVRVEIDSAEPIGGWIGEGELRRARFDGWLQLISLLERLATELEPAAGEPPSPARGGAGSEAVPPPRAIL